MRSKLPYPFNEYVGYDQIIKGRSYIYLWNNPKGRLISKARFLMSIKLGRLLLPTEDVDHIEGNKSNDSLDNLQVLSPSDNKRKAIVETGRSATYTELICANCGKALTRTLRVHRQRTKEGRLPACSRSCGSFIGWNKAEVVKRSTTPDL